jgi:queuine/archaeosine tRNA-ribosyltransferase
LHSGAGKVAEVGQLLSQHNLFFQKDLMSRQRAAILNHTYDAWVRQFLTDRFGALQTTPKWIIDALTAAEIEL